MRCFVWVFLYRAAVYNIHDEVAGALHGELCSILLKMLMAHLALGDLFVLTFLLHVRAVLKIKKKQQVNK